MKRPIHTVSTLFLQFLILNPSQNSIFQIPFCLNTFLHIFPCVPFSTFATSFSSIMALKISRPLHILLLLSLLLLVFHEFYNLNSNINKNHTTQPTHSIPSSHHLLTGRKFLATKFDFSPFFKHHQPGVAAHHDPSDTEIDPRYGVEKRRVPTGPNPLHH